MVMYRTKPVMHTRDVPVDTLSRPEQSSSAEIRHLNASDAEAFRVLRLNALREFPEAFGMGYAEERDRPWADYVQRFQSEWTADDNAMLGAFVNGRLVGSLGLRRWEREKQRHKGYIWIFFVVPQTRGHGIGRRLLDAGVQYARQLAELQQIQLSVTAGSRSARSLYVSFGFEPYGCERKALKVQDTFIDLELMALHFS